MAKKLTNKKVLNEPATRLTNQNVAHRQITPLTSDKRSSVKFKLAIDHTLENGYTFKKLKSAGLKHFSEFLVSTVGKGLTITEVESLYLRTKGPHGAKNLETANHAKREMLHFGKSQFRLHGYYENDYFVVHRIDPEHKYNYKG